MIRYLIIFTIFADTSKDIISCASTITIRRTSPRLPNLTTAQIKDTIISSSSSARKRKLYDMLEYAKPPFNNHPPMSGRVRRRGSKCYTCSHQGCTNHAQKGGVCCRHGAKKKNYICRHEGCTNQVIKGGVCVRHGAAKRKTCNHEGCTNQEQRGGVCCRHGAKVKKCSHEGCSNYPQRGGVCCRHGAKVKVKTCSHKGCTNQVIKGGVCIRHGAKRIRRLCSMDECTNIAVKGGVCIRHGAKVETCSHRGCSNQVVNGGVCIRHGAKVKDIIVVMKDAPNMQRKEESVLDMVQKLRSRSVSSHEGYTNIVKKGGVCKRHGAKQKKCTYEVCTNNAQ